MNDPVPDDLRARVAALPRELPPPRDLWPGVHAGLPRSVSGPTRRTDLVVGYALAAAVALAAIVFWPRAGDRPAAEGWSVAALSGSPRIGRQSVAEEGRWRRGQWLETDAVSRAQLEVGTIGQLQVEPNSRLRLVSTAAPDHRVELERGRLSAFIWAPPRLFFVETPSATAIDLGCAYTLAVDDDGTGILHVTAGYVALVLGERESIIPAGLACLTRRGIGPGTPFAADAPAAFRESLARWDFHGDVSALEEVLATARPDDDITLWHLLARAPARLRGPAHDRLAASVAPPPEVTREGIIAGDPAMRNRWALALGLVPSGSGARGTSGP